MRTREERRDEERRYEGDVVYDVWRSGGNPDRVNLERVDEHFYRGDESDSATRDELRHQRPPQPEYEYPEEQEEVKEKDEQIAALIAENKRRAKVIALYEDFFDCWAAIKQVGSQGDV